MPTYSVTDPDSGRKVNLTGDSPPTEQELEEIFASLPPAGAAVPLPAATPQYQDPNTDIPQIGADGRPLPLRPSAPAQDPSLTDYLKGGAEAALTVGTAATGGLVGNLVGSAKGIGQSIADGTYGTQAGADAAAQEAQRLGSMFTYEPRTEQGQNTLQAVGEMAAPIAGLPGLAGEAAIIGNSARAAIPAARGAAAEVGALKDIRKSPLEIEQGKTDFVKSQLEAGKTSNSLATKAIEGGKVVDSSEAKEAVNQGFEEGLVSAINSTSPLNKAQLLKMVRISEQGKKDSRFASENRPSDVVGDSLAKRLSYLKSINTNAGKQLDEVAKSLKTETADPTAAKNNFLAKLDDMGITIDEKNNLNFKGSDVEGLASQENALKRIAKRITAIDSGNAYKMHQLKRYIDQNVSYGKSSSAEGLTAKTESVLKGLRSDIDSALDSSFPKYDKVNTQYSDTIRAIDDFQGAAGGTINLFGDNADKSLGTVTRRLLSNAQSRVGLIDAMKSVDDVTQKYGAKYNDDIMTQAMFANALDKHFGAAAKTSLLGDLETAGSSALERSIRGDATFAGLGIEGFKAVKNKVQGKNEENSYKALKALLQRKQDQ